jgi:hypothetical protein
MPLPNRVDPFGELFAHAARGVFMGNRGGRFHREDRTLGQRRWTSPQWICCRLAFKGRHRDVWHTGYTELFFLDEPTALAAGHRPCFECRRNDAETFAEAWKDVFALPERPRAAEMDRVLHAERLDGRGKRTHRMPIDGLPDGVFVVQNGGAFAVSGGALLQWTPAGYAKRVQRPSGATVDILTPPAIVRVLAAGFAPRWHPSALVA